MQFNKSVHSANKILLAVLTATLVIGGQFPAHAQTYNTNSVVCIPRWVPIIGGICYNVSGSGSPNGGTVTVRPVPIPALGIGLAALGMGLARKRRQFAAQKAELPVEEVRSTQA